MVKNILNLGLVCVPLVIWKGMDLRTPKEIVGFGIALTIGLVSMYYGSLKRFKNYWLLVFVGFMFVSMLYSPNFKCFLLTYVEHDINRATLLPEINMSGFWAFKTFGFALVYLLMTISVASIEFEYQDLRRTLYFMAGTGLFMALYIFVQHFGLDQFFSLVTIDPQVKHMTKPLLGGFIGQPTIVSPFIAMIVPVALYLKRYVWAVCMVVAVCLTLSEVAIGAMVLGVLLYLCISGRKNFKAVGISVVILMLIGGLFITHKYKDKSAIDFVKFRSSGRIGEWEKIYTDFKNPPLKEINKKFTVTGFGPGSFRYAYSMRNKSMWRQAHNEFLEVLYNFGLIGLALYLLAVWNMLRSLYMTSFVDEFHLSLIGSFAIIFICSFATFPFHIAPTMFYTAVIVGILHNEHLRRIL
jgi:hypothetical protein